MTGTSSGVAVTAATARSERVPWNRDGSVKTETAQAPALAYAVVRSARRLSDPSRPADGEWRLYSAIRPKESWNRNAGGVGVASARARSAANGDRKSVV